MHVGALQVLGDLRAACFLVGHGATMHGGGQAGDRGATEAAVVEDGFVAGGRAVDSLKGRRHEIGRRSNSWIRPSALMVAASSSSATWSKLHRGLLALGQIIEAELDCRIA
jgi:hypothetical protein